MASALRASEVRYRRLFEHIPLMYFTLDGDGTVASVNEHGARELGYESAELVGRTLLEVFHPEDRPVVRRQLEWVLDCPNEVSRWELRKVRKNGTVVWVRDTVRAVHAADGTPEILVVCEDVTERRRAVERLAEARDQLRDLNAELSRAEEREDRRIARVLHDEVGQALAAARMTVCELRDSEPSEARVARLEELRALVERSIEVTRSLTFRLSPPILHDLGLAAALQALGERTEEDHGLRFEFEREEAWSPPGEAAGVVLYRVVRELFHNVVKHARASRVHLALVGTGGGRRIVVEDDGMGFDAVGGDAVGGDAVGGDAGAESAGRSLGLFHARERMERLGGRFEIDSAPGRGTRAVLHVPLEDRRERRRGDRRRSP